MNSSGAAYLSALPASPCDGQDPVFHCQKDLLSYLDSAQIENIQAARHPRSQMPEPHGLSGAHGRNLQLSSVPCWPAQSRRVKNSGE
jgi:hypothetical protein